MADAVEVAIEAALLERAQAFANAQSPAIPIAVPNVVLTGKPEPSKTANWLRATFLPADSFATGVSFGARNQHSGLLQIDVFYGQGAGELAPGRIAAALIAYFKRGTTVTRNSFSAQVIQTPRRAQLIQDDPWVFIPVRIPYLCFATPPA